MTSIAHLLEDFGGESDGLPVTLTEMSLEEERLASFEKGYQAGWDDSLKAQRDDARQVAADLAQNLRDLSFTYEEAYAAVLKAIAPVIEQALRTVLPRVSQDMLLPRVSEVLVDLAAHHGRQPVSIKAAPSDLAALEHLREAMPDLEVAIDADAVLSTGQVQIGFGEVERDIDMAEVLQTIDAALAAFFSEQRRETA